MYFIAIVIIICGTALVSGSVSMDLHSDASFSNSFSSWPLIQARDGQHDSRKRAVRLCVGRAVCFAVLLLLIAVWRGGQRQPSVDEKHARSSSRMHLSLSVSSRPTSRSVTFGTLFAVPPPPTTSTTGMPADGEPAASNKPCLCHLVDVGLNNGDSLTRWPLRAVGLLKHLPGRAELREQLATCVFQARAERVCYTGVEPNKVFTPRLKGLERTLRSRQHNVTIYTETAVSLSDGMATLNIPVDCKGAICSSIVGRFDKEPPPHRSRRGPEPPALRAHKSQTVKTIGAAGFISSLRTAAPLVALKMCAAPSHTEGPWHPPHAQRHAWSLVCVCARGAAISRGKRCACHRPDTARAASNLPPPPARARRRQFGLFNNNSVLTAVCRAVTLLAVEWHPLKAPSESQPELTLQKIQGRLAKCGVALLPWK